MDYLTIINRDTHPFPNKRNTILSEVKLSKKLLPALTCEFYQVMQKIMLGFIFLMPIYSFLLE